MATVKQYDVFQFLYDEESKNYTYLEARARYYLAVITFYIGAVAFKFEDVVKFTKGYRVPMFLYLALAFCLLLALFFVAMAVRIRSYERVCDPEETIRRFNNHRQVDDDFLDNRIVDLAVATNTNAEQNRNVGRYLSLSAWFIVAGVVVQISIVLIAICTEIS